MSNTRYVFFNDATREILEIVDLPQTALLATTLAASDANYIGIAVRALELLNTFAIQDPNPREHEINSAKNNIQLRNLTGSEDNPFFVDPTPLAAAPIFQWRYHNGQTTSNLPQQSPESNPQVGQENRIQYSQGGWVREVVNNGNGVIPDGNTYEIEQANYFNLTGADELARFDVDMRLRTAHHAVYFSGSAVEVTCQFIITDSGATLYRSTIQTIAHLRATNTLDRMVFADVALLNIPSFAEVKWAINVTARHIGGTTSELGIATDSLKVTRSRISQ